MLDPDALVEQFRNQNERQRAMHRWRRIAKNIRDTHINSLFTNPNCVIQAGERIESDVNLRGFFASNLTEGVGKVCFQRELARRHNSLTSSLNLWILTLRPTAWGPKGSRYARDSRNLASIGALRASCTKFITIRSLNIPARTGRIFLGCSD